MSHESRRPKSIEWYTPPEIFTALDIAFDLDPCAPALPAASYLPVEHRYSRPLDGFSLPWEGRVWLNPPYGEETGKWVGKLAHHGEGIALVFVRTDVAWWQRAAECADAICFIKGRVNFISGDPSVQRHRSGVSPAPSCLLAFGIESAKAVASCGLGIVAYPQTCDNNLELTIAVK